MPRIFNFSPGPATLPEAVLQQAADEMMDWRDRGMSIMEMSHRGKDFMPVHAQAESDLRELMGIPDNYKVLFLQGGACGQNAFIPMNLLGHYGTADYVDTGEWSQRSIAEAQRYGKVNVAASAKDNGYTAIPTQNTWQLDPKAAYVHICSNETIGGLEYHWTPDTAGVPLVGDMSSNILSREMDVTRYGLIYAGAQKNIGPSGLTIVLVRDDLLDRALPITPSVFCYKTQAENGSMLNTPPTFAIYMAGLMFQWIKSQGGVSVMESRNRAKAALLYDYIDASSFYENRIAKADRSLVNVPFHLRDDSLNEAFLQGALEQGLAQLKGHRIIGGMRASIYNAMPMEGVQALVAYMREFERLRA